MKKNRNLLFVLIACALVALVVFAACDPEDGAQTKVLDYIELDTSNAQTEFTVGDMLNYQGLSVTAYYDNDTSAIVTGYIVTANGLDDDGKLTADSNEATVTYTEEGVTKTATYGITVTAKPDDSSKEDPEKNVVSIKITKLPTTTEYYVGETFSTAGLEIEATYDDDTTDTITSGFSASASTAMSGEKTITVTYKGKTDTFTINVYDKLSGLSIEGKRAYAIGDEFDGIYVVALYNGKTNGGVQIDESDYTWNITPALNDGKFDTIGKYTITVEYSEEKIAGNLLKVDGTFEITVSDPEDPNAIAWGEEGMSDGEWKYWIDDENVIVSIEEVKFIHGDNDGINIHAAFSATGTLYYGFQLFYNDTTNYNIDDSYVLTLTITSKTNCTVVINNKSYTLTANDPTQVEVAFKYTYNGIYTGMSLFDMQVEIVEGESYDLTLTNIAWTESSQSDTPGGGGGDTGNVVTYKTEFDPNIIGVWCRAAGFTQADFNSAELLIDGNHFAYPYQVLTGGDNEFKPMFNNIFSLAGSADGAKYLIQIKINDVIYDPVTEIFGGPHTSNGNTYTLSVEDGKLVLTVKSASSTVDPNPGTGGDDDKDDPIVPGDGYVVELTNTVFYNDMFIKLYMSSEDFNLLKSAAKVVVNDSYTGDNWTGGFLVDGNDCLHVRLTQLAPSPSGTYVLNWYDADGNLIATCSVTI